MSLLRLYSLFDVGVGAYLRPFWSDHKENAIRAFRKLINDKSSPDNMPAQHPEQFCLFELGVFDPQSGKFIQHENNLSLGLGIEYLDGNTMGQTSPREFKLAASE